MAKTYLEFVKDQGIDLDDFPPYSDGWAFLAFYSVTGSYYGENSDWDSFYNDFIDEYYGYFPEREDFIRQFIGEIYDISYFPEVVAQNINWDGIWKQWDGVKFVEYADHYFLRLGY